MRFAEILETKLREQTEVKSSFPPPSASEKFPSQTRPEPLEIRLASQGWEPLNPPRKSGQYPAPPPRKTAAPRPPLVSPEPSFGPDDLSPAERDGLQFFILSGALGLSESFSAAKLRTEYRKLVRRLHPDRSFHQGPDATTKASRQFQALQDAKQKLARFF